MADLKDRERIAALFESTAGDTNAVRSTEPLPDLLAGGSASEEVLIEADDVSGLCGIFGKQFNAKVAESARDERRNDLGRALRYGAEQRITAADIGVQHVFHADAVAKFHSMNVARAAAVVLIGARR